MRESFPHPSPRLPRALRLVLAGLLAFAPAVPAGTAGKSGESFLKGVDYKDNRVRISLDHMAPYRVYTLTGPQRLVVDLSGTTHGPGAFSKTVGDGVLSCIRSSQFSIAPDKITRVVLELPRPSAYDAFEEGNNIVLHLGEGKVSDRARGEDSAAVDAAAVETLQRRKSAGRGGEDLVSSLPRNRVSIDFDDADIRDVIKVLADMSGVNMIYSAETRGNVTIHLDQVPFNEVFNTILTLQGLVTQQLGDNILRIMTPDALSADRARAVTTYKTVTLNYAKVADVSPHLAAAKISPSGTITVDNVNNALVIKDTPEGIEAAERLIRDLDRRPQQVLIEAKLVDVTLTDNLDIGIQWEYANQKYAPGGPFGNPLDQGYLTSTQGQINAPPGLTIAPGTVGFGLAADDGTGTGTTEDFTLNAIGPSGRGTGVALPGPQEAAITFGFLKNGQILSATLNALAKKGQTKILSSPKIITLNNQLAKIQVGSRIPYTTTTIGQSGASSTSITFVDTGIQLQVTPTISSNGRIRLKIKPESSSPRATGNSAAGPTVDTKTAETEVIILDGETLVIGGLIDETTTRDLQKVPLLGDIPVLGTFFRHTVDDKTRHELLVFVTPRIVQD
jgi:type IV pilus assembly protein PilQ